MKCNNPLQDKFVPTRCNITLELMPVDGNIMEYRYLEFHSNLF
jgi:hypothetical protein